LVFFCLFFTIISPSYCGTIDPSISDSKYLEFGEQFYCVVKICGKYKDGTLFCASAVAIDKNHILTAAHVVQNYELCYITIKDKKFELSKITIHKDFEINGFGVADIALGYCKEDFGLDGYPPIYFDEDEVGKVCAISGYGLTGNFNTGINISDNKKRAGSNKIDYIDRDLLICSASKRGTEGYTNLEFLIGSGDSGGGLFIDGKLAGINSCVMVVGKNKVPMSKYGEESGHTRISKFVQWIKDHRTK
jgi:hypothetical protein